MLRNLNDSIDFSLDQKVHLCMSLLNQIEESEIKECAKSIQYCLISIACFIDVVVLSNTHF